MIPMLQKDLDFPLLIRLKPYRLYPRLGRVVPEEQIEAISELIISLYRIVYEIYEKEKVLYIVRVWHSARRKSQIH